MKRPRTDPGVSLLPSPVDSGSWADDAEVEVIFGRAVATAATVWSSSGVVVYGMISNSKVTLEKGRLDTGDALGKATRSDAGLLGLNEDRSKGAGLKTL